MDSVWAIVPVKSPSRAKTRLAPVLAPDECAALSHAMLQDVLAALAASQSIDHVAVLTDDPQMEEFVRTLGHEVFRESNARNLSDALNSLARDLRDRGATTLLIIPGDMPTVRPEDVDNLLSRHAGSLSICPAIRDGGTNVLVCSPPTAIEFHYGEDSARKHLDAALESGVSATRMPLQPFFRDIDVPEDLAWLARQDRATSTGTYLRVSGISARLRPYQPEATS